jgi:hypothetical protein
VDGRGGGVCQNAADMTMRPTTLDGGPGGEPPIDRRAGSP